MAFSFVIRYNTNLFSKIEEYINPTINYGSAYFRKQSNVYGISSFISSPFIGCGIGTVYCHSMLIQSLSNIGILGVVLTFVIHLKALKTKKTHYKNVYISVCLFVIFIILSSSSMMLQQFTSPVLLAIILSIAIEKDCCDDAKNNRDVISNAYIFNYGWWFRRKILATINQEKA